MDFKSFIASKIQYFSSHFRKNAVLLQQNGEPLFEIDLSFDTLTDQYMKKCQNMQMNQASNTQSLSIKQLAEQQLKINDDHLLVLWQHLTNTYEQMFNIENQNIGDLTLLKLADLYAQGRCKFSKLNFCNNLKISQIGVMGLSHSLRIHEVSSCITSLSFHDIPIGMNGSNRLIELIPCCKNLKSIDLGLIGNKSLTYLTEILKNAHCLISLGFGQDLSDPWQENSVKGLVQIIRRNQNSKQLLSINFYPNNIVKYWATVNELNILCQKRRQIKFSQRQNEFKAAALNQQHGKYYDPQNHSLNAYKFSVKSYLTNVFGSELDEALYFLQKERRNSLREQAIFQITRQPINKLILEDICTADGSIVVLAKYLLGKIKDKQI